MSGLNSDHIDELLHCLQTLDAELFEAAKNRLLTESEYSVRNDRLRHAFHTLGEYKELVAQRELPIEFKSQVDLPIMGGYSRVEQKVVTHFVSDTRRHTQQLANAARKVAKWTFDAAGNSVGSARSLWRLSWLRASILRINQDLANVRKARLVVENFIERTALGGITPNSKINQQDLLTAFCEFDASIARVTAMKSGLSREITRNRDMRRWLSLYSKMRRQRNPETAPPEPSAVENASKFVDEPLTLGTKFAKERLVIARQVEAALSDWESAKRNDSKQAKENVRKAKYQAKRAQLPDEKHAAEIHFIELAKSKIDVNHELTADFSLMSKTKSPMKSMPKNNGKRQKKRCS